MPIRLLLLAVLFACRAPSLETAHAFRAAQPRHLRPLEPSAVPTGMPDTRAATCGGCHREIYEEWRVSTHAAAWMGDPQFQAELNKSRKEGDVGWMCVNCHTPQWSQIPQVVAALDGGRKDRPFYVPNPDYLPGSEEDAISCAACHVRDGVIEGPWGGDGAPHPVRKAERLRSEAVCTECHQASAAFPEIGLACMFNTGQEWKAGPYDEEGVTCPVCHMPPVDGPVAVGGPIRTRRIHQFGGSMIPKTPGDEPKVAPFRAVFPEGLTAAWADLPQTLAAGQPFRLELVYRNERAGHLLPTGDPERSLVLAAVARDATSGLMLAEAEVRIGMRITWWPKVVVEEDNRLAPREERRLVLEGMTPPSGSVTLHLEVTKHRISAENLKFHQLEGRIVPSRVIMNTETVLPVSHAGPP